VITMSYRTQDLTELAKQWADEVEEDAVGDSTPYRELCEELGIDTTPQALEDFADDYEPTLIDRADFKEYAMELAEEIGAYPSGGTSGLDWPLTCIDWERAARDLAHDYTMVSYEGRDYYIRSW
jgi:antirestriction protein